MGVDRPSRFDALAGRIQQLLLDTGLPSVSVAIAQDGNLVWEEGFGWADREARTPATPHTLYSLASISKPITTTALMVLAERGLVDLDAPINTYLGDSPVRARLGQESEATVRQVADHTSGLPLHFHFFYQGEDSTPPPMEETIRRYGHLMTPPGEHHLYSNLGYGILGHLVSRVSGMPFAQFAQEEVFLPLGMVHSSLGVPDHLGRYVARRYGADNVPYPPYTTDHPGASEFWASAHDLVRFGMFHIGERMPGARAILSAESRRQMQIPSAQINEREGYGLGWGTNSDDKGYRTVSHNGGMGGVQTILWMIPDERVVLAVLANGSHQTNGALGRIVGDIGSVLLPPFGEKLASQRAARAQAQVQEPERAPVEIPADMVGDWTGSLYTHAGEVPLALSFREDGDVHARVGDDLQSLVNDVAVEDGYVTGKMLGTMPTSDARTFPHHLLIDLLKVRGDALTGALSTYPVSEVDGGTPAVRLRNALTHFARLRRA